MKKFSYYKPPITNKIPEKDITLTALASLIREGRGVRSKISELRSTQNEEIKKKLPYVTLSGTFTKRKSEYLVEHSGLICIDLDGAMIDTLDDPLPAMHFVSPRGNGQKIIYAIDIERGSHLEYFYALEEYFRAEHGITIDPACKDITRACWLSYDTDVVVNEKPTMVGKEFLKKYKKTDTPPEAEANLQPGTRNNTLFQEALEAARQGRKKADVLKEFSQYAADDFPLAEIKKIVNNAYHYRPDKIPYVRVGTNYFKIIQKQDRHGIERRELKPWNKDTITEDHKRKFLAYVPKYDDFAMLPSNIEYKPIVKGCYNLYAPFNHTPAPERGDMPWSIHMLRHVFGEQLKQGIKYMQILYLHPEKSTVILALVSKENKTGKTTFCNWLHMLFGQNVALLSSSDFTSGFNSSYATKNLLIIEETLLEKRMTIEKLKALVTSKYIQVNEKYVTPYKIPFHGKVVLTSNNVDKFALVDPKETRFFVRKLSKPTNFNANIEDDLLREIPAFLRYLQDLPPVDWSVDRSGFTTSELANENLRAVQDESMSTLYKELRENIIDHFNNHEIEQFLATVKDIKEKWFFHDNRIGTSYIGRVLKNEFEMKAKKLQKYTAFDDMDTRTGRPYRFLRTDFVTEEVDDNVEIDKDLLSVLPF